MKVSKWGNSLAIRIPAEVAQKIGLQEGDEAAYRVTAENKLEIGRDRRREEALERFRELRVVLPEDFVFDRDEIYDS
jgi:antitoxin MazE